MRAGSIATCSLGFEQSQNHDRLAEAHIVGEAATKAEAPQKFEPAERLALIFTQGPGERFRRIDGTDAAELLQLGAGAAESFVDRDRGLILQERIEQCRLRRPVADVIAFR